MKWYTISPLIYTDIESDMVIGTKWAGGVTLIKTPRWLLEKKVMSQLSTWQRDRLRSRSKLSLQVQYDAESLGEADPTWKHKGTLSKQDVAQEYIRIATLCLWLARPTSLTNEVIFHVEDPDINGEHGIREIRQIGRIFPNNAHEQRAQHDQDTIRESIELSECVKKLPRQDGAVWTALYVLWRALSEIHQGEVRILLLWIALEALFGPKDAREIRHRIAERIALFLPEDLAEARVLYRQVKRGYDTRSKIAHGMRLDEGDRSGGDRTMMEAQALAQRCLVKILRDERLCGLFNGKRREEYLDELAFRLQRNETVVSS